MRRYIIEREILAIGSAEREALKAAAQKSNEVLRELGPDIQWIDVRSGRQDLLRVHGER